jgi:hypothetical protein
LKKRLTVEELFAVLAAISDVITETEENDGRPDTIPVLDSAAVKLIQGHGFTISGLALAAGEYKGTVDAAGVVTFFEGRQKN